MGRISREDLVGTAQTLGFENLEAYARHVGFGDGLRMSIGQLPVEESHPAALACPSAYADGMSAGMISGTNFVRPSLGRPFLGHLGRSLWDETSVPVPRKFNPSHHVRDGFRTFMLLWFGFSMLILLVVCLLS